VVLLEQFQLYNLSVSLFEVSENCLEQWRVLFCLILSVGVGNFGSSAVSSILSGKQHEFSRVFLEERAV
jgi:hypothetical protein